MIYIFIGLFGLVFGSFYNVLIYRLPRNKDIVFERSHCPSCDHGLGVLDLIPMVSYMVQFGKCRYCRAAISWRYPVVECLSSAILLISFMQFDFTWMMAKSYLFLSVLLILFFTDVETMLLPDWLTFGLLGLGLIDGAISGQIMGSIWGAGVGFLVFFLIGVVGKLVYKQDALGWGDVKLSAGIGALLGAKLNLMAIFFSFLIGSVYSLFFLITKKKSRKDPIPFGPAIVLGSLVVYFFGEGIWAWYIG